MQLVDTHCHLFSEEFDADRAEVIERAKSLGVSYFLLPNIDSATIEPLYKTCTDFENVCLPMMGLHPTSVKENYREEMKRIEQELDGRKFIAIGEIGLDYYWDLTFKDQQIEVFRTQLKWAKEKKLPVAIHTRNSFEDAIRIVEEEKDENLRGVFHCFSGTALDAQRAIGVGFYLGIGGVVTFKNGGLDKILPEISISSVVLETDSPYLAPVPYRGKRNESSYLREIVARVSEILDRPAEEIATLTTANAFKLFNLSKLKNE